jgi:hypothetical protein
MLKKISSVLVLFAVLFFLCYKIKAYGQPPPPPGGGSGAPCWPPPCSVPIDGGIGFLIAAGAALAGKKFYDLRKKSKGE